MDAYKTLNLDSGHQLFIRQNEASERCKLPLNQTLYILNVPPYFDEASIKSLFSTFGDIIQVDLMPPKKFRFKSAHVVFSTSNGLKSALNNKKIINCESSMPLTGLSKWSREFKKSVVDEKELQRQINEFMEHHDREESRRINGERSESEDESGWVQVTRHGRIQGFKQNESVVTRLEKKLKVAREKGILPNFYSFQQRDAKKQHIIELKRKFDKDKKKLSHIKKCRKFNPF